MTTQTVTIRYKVDASGAIQATGAVVKTVTQLGAAANTTNKALADQRRQIGSIQGALREYTQNLRSLFGLYLTFQGVQTFSRFVDEYTNLNGRLKVVIDNTQKYAVAQTQVYQIAQATYSSLSATANLYARLTVSLEELNSSQSEVALITKTVNQALLVSGATSAEASSAIIQLSQSFASGVLRGEEFNAVNEAAPRIMTALAKSLGVSRGALREMASEGKLTAEVLRKALVDDALNIAKEAENVPLTIGRGYERLRNDLLQYVGAADSVYGVSRKVAEGLVYIGNNLDSLASALGETLTVLGVFLGAKGLAGFAISAGSMTGAVALMRTSLIALGTALGGIPALIGAAVVALVVFRDEIFSVGEVSDQAADNLERLKLLFKIDPDASAKLAVETYEMLKDRISEVRTELENLDTSGLGFLDRGIKGNQLTAELKELESQLVKADAEFDKFGNHAERASRAAGSGADATRKLANDQKLLADALVASGDPMGRQLKAYQELSTKLQSYDELIKRQPQNEAILTAAKKEAITALQKELALIGKSTKVKKESQATALSRAAAEERLNNIIAQYSREQDDANKVLKQHEAIKSEVMRLEGQHPGLINLTGEALSRIGERIEEASDKFFEFNEAIREMFEEFEQGNINTTSQQLLQLGLALDAAMAAGDTAQIEKILRVMEAIEQQAGLSATASDELRDSNQRLTDAARDQAEAYEQYWEGAFSSIADAIGEFVADGMRDWKSFGDSLKNIAKKIIADIIAEFIKLKVINPIMNQLFGAMQNGMMRSTGSSGGGLIGSLFGSSGGGGGFNLSGLIGSIFGGGTGSISSGMGIQQINVITGAGTSGSAGGFMSGGGGMFGSGGTGVTAGGVLGAAGGVAMGLQGIRTGNALQGAAGGAMAGFQIGGPWGALIGGIIGGLGALIHGKKEPDFRLGGGDASIRNREGGFETVFGEVQAGSRQLSWESLVEPIQQFDIAIQDLVTTMGGGEPQLDAITEALATWEVDLRGSAATAENILNSRFSAILETFSEDVQAFVGTTGTVQERVGKLTDALAIEMAVVAGELGDTFSGVADLLTRNRIGTEALTDTYNRVLASVQLMDAAVLMTGTNFDLTRDQFVDFAADMVTAAGGLERASQLWEAYFQTFYSDDERQAFAVQNARTSASSALETIGLDLGDYEGDGALARFRTLFEEMLPTLSAEATVQWLEAANALGGLVQVTSVVNEVVEESVESFSSLAELMGAVKEDLNEFSTETLTFAERIASLSADIDALVGRALALGASEEQIAAIRELGVQRMGRLLAEQATAVNAYTDFIAGFQSDPTAGLSEFQQTLVQIAQDASNAATEANRLAVAAGLAGVSTEDLATIQLRAAELASQAALRLEQSIISLRDQLGYLDEAATAATSLAGLIYGRFELPGQSSETTVDPERFNLAATLGAQIRELAEFTGETVIDLMERLQVPFDRIMADFGVSIQNIGDPEIFDRLATASRTMGIELSDAASQLGINIGALSDASSLLNDGFERAVSRLPTAVSNQLNGLLRGLENAIGPEAQAEAQRMLADFINAQPPAIRDALAPYLEDVDTSSVESQQLGAAEQTNRYLGAANEYLARIASNTGVTSRSLTSPAGVGPGGSSAKTRAEEETHRLLKAIVSGLGNMEKEFRTSGIASKVGMNNG